MAAADSVIGLHGTDAASVFLSARARMAGCEVPAVEGALYEARSLLRVLAMRRTMFVAPLDMASVLLAACSRELAARERARAVGLVADAGLGDGDPAGWFATAEAAGLRALQAHEEATAPELAEEDPHLSAVLVLSEGRKYEARQKVISRVLTVLGAEGRAIRTRPRGGWTSTQFRWAALERWQPAARLDLDAEAAREQLARRWLSAFSPATAEDLRWWTGWSVAVTRRALATLETVVVDVEGHECLILADDMESEAPVEPWVALLPALDSTTMGWRERGWYLGAHGSQLFDRNGNAGPTAWVDGRVVGGWAQGGDGEVRVRLLENVGAEVSEALNAEAAALTDWLGDVRLAPRARARSPLEQALLA